MSVSPNRAAGRERAAGAAGAAHRACPRRDRPVRAGRRVGARSRPQAPHQGRALPSIAATRHGPWISGGAPLTLGRLQSPRRPFAGRAGGSRGRALAISNERRRVMLLTGASRGIGHATVKRFSAAGWRVITCSRHAFPENCPWEMGPEDHLQVDLADRRGHASRAVEGSRRAARRGGRGAARARRRCRHLAGARTASAWARISTPGAVAAG